MNWKEHQITNAILLWNSLPPAVGSSSTRQFRPEQMLSNFFSKVSGLNTDGCHEWTGCKIHNRHGIATYGQLNVRSSRLVASRVAWIIEHGLVPANLDVCHQCDNPPCCNPSHLFLGTRKQNMEDCSEKGRVKSNPPKGSKNNMAKLTEAQVLEIRAIGSTMLHREIAARYGIHKSNVSLILRGKWWKHLLPAERKVA